MKGFILLAFIITANLMPHLGEAASHLSDRDLAAVSGGAVDPRFGGQELDQDQQNPGLASLNDTTSANSIASGVANSDGMDLSPTLFAVLQSRVNSKRKRKLHLYGNTQQNGIAFNIENILAADSVVTSNIFDASSLGIADIISEVEINQVNTTYQNHRTQGSLTSAVSGYRYETIISELHVSESYNYHRYSLLDQKQLSEIEQTIRTFNHSQVGSHFTSLDELAAEGLPVHLLDAIEYGPYLAFGPILGAGYSGTTFTGLGMDLDTIKAQNGNLVFGTRFILPELDFGYAYSALLPDVHFGSLGGGEVPQDLILYGFAPQIDECNWGNGFVLSGEGRLTTIDPGIFTIDGELSFELTSYAKVVLDLSKTFLKIPKQTVLDVSVDLIDLDIALGLLELDIEPFDVSPGDTDITSTEISLQNNDYSEIQKLVDVAESSYEETHYHSVVNGGQMAGAEAELLALSEGKLSVDNSSSVLLSDSSQQNMRVFNGVNAASSVAANGQNILKMVPGRTGAGNVCRSVVKQHNSFNQKM